MPDYIQQLFKQNSIFNKQDMLKIEYKKMRKDFQEEILENMSDSDVLAKIEILFVKCTHLNRNRRHNFQEV